MGEYDILFNILVISISLIAMIMSIITRKKIRPAEQQQIAINVKQQDSSSMLACFNLLGSTETKVDIEKVANYYRNNNNTKKVIFDAESIIISANRLKESFNQACILYQLELINRLHFEKVFAGKIVRTWKMFKDDIKENQKKNPNYGQHFEEVTAEFIESGYNDEPY